MVHAPLAPAHDRRCCIWARLEECLPVAGGGAEPEVQLFITVSTIIVNEPASRTVQHVSVTDTV